MADTKYNGWTNYETWNVKLWIDNDEGSYQYWREQAQECYDQAGENLSAYGKLTGREIFNREERAALVLGGLLKDSIHEAAPDLGASMYTDMLNASLSEVDWQEIAASMIGDVDKVEEEETEEAND